MKKYKFFKPDEYYKPFTLRLTVTPQGKFNTVSVRNLSQVQKYYAEINEQCSEKAASQLLKTFCAGDDKRWKKKMDADLDLNSFLAECDSDAPSRFAQQEQDIIGQAESVYKAAKAKDNIIRPILALLAFLPFLYECFCVWKAFSATDSMVMKVIYGIIVLAALLLVFLKAKAHKLLWYSTADDDSVYEFSYCVRRFGKMTKTYLLATLYTWLIAAAMYGLLFAIDWLAGLFS